MQVKYESSACSHQLQLPATSFILSFCLIAKSEKKMSVPAQILISQGSSTSSDAHPAEF